jgi:hypothetical protein
MSENYLFWVEHFLQSQKQPFQTLSQFDLNFVDKSKAKNTEDLIDKLVVNLVTKKCSKEDFETIFDLIYKKFQLDEMPEILYPLNSRDWIIDSMEYWAETFDFEEADYNYIYKLINRYKSDCCSLEDYESIIFFLWQKYADEDWV